MKGMGILIAIGAYFKGMDLVDERVLLAANKISMAVFFTVMNFFTFFNLSQI